MVRRTPATTIAVLVAMAACIASPGASSVEPYRAYLPAVANDVAHPPPNSEPERPPPGPGYCGPAAGPGTPIPPNSAFGLLTIAGLPAPAGTLVTLTFDGKPGPSAFTRETGGYRVDYAAGGQGHDPPCINQVGSELGLLVNGWLASSGRAVGDPQTGLALRFDVSAP